jgi:hypothetical protein
MPMRQFADNDGRVWEVWETRPAKRELRGTYRERLKSLHNAPTVTSMMQGLEHGWLTFRSGVEKRRFAPIPENWVAASEDQLGRWCKRARPVPVTAGNRADSHPRAAESRAHRRPDRDSGD